MAHKTVEDFVTAGSSTHSLKASILRTVSKNVFPLEDEMHRFRDARRRLDETLRSGARGPSRRDCGI